MTGDEQQEQAALYALGLLDADEAEAFEKLLETDAELGALTRGLTETVASLAYDAPQRIAPPALKARLMAEIAASKPTTAAAAPPAKAATKVTPFVDVRDDKRDALPIWLPWAIAAGLSLFCGVTLAERTHLNRQIAALQNADPFRQTSVYKLAPVPDGPAKAFANVSWDASHQNGCLRVNGLPTPASGKDYQLWVINKDSKQPINAGVFRVDEHGVAQIYFKPEAKATHAAVFAVSLERAGGSPTNQGPLVLAGGM
jgi:anti-sigma-K factor RskA